MQIIKQDKGIIAQVINNRFTQHLIYWVAFIVFFAFAWGTHDDNYLKTLEVELVNLPAKILLVYSVIYFLFPRYLYRGKTTQFIILFILFVFIASVLQRLGDNYIVIDNFFPEWNKEGTLNIVQLVRAAVNFGAVLAIPLTVKLMEYLARVQQNEQTLARDKMEAELAFLKNQVQPHFLFNTLNSLYALILKKSDQSLDVILKLSDLLRYMLYETNVPQVKLDKELESIKSYLELEQIRYGKRVDLSFNAWGDFHDKTIAPMLILPFIENSFKHSTKGFNEKAMIAIEMGSKDEELVLKVENSLPTHQSGLEDPLASGIGLQNVKRRLELLYPDSYSLKIESEKESFMIVLKLQLQHK